MDKIVFMCRKCGYEIEVKDNDINLEFMVQLAHRECDECGEEPFENWVLEYHTSK